MKLVVDEINQVKNNKLWKFTKLIALTGSAQILVQALSLITGFLIVRSLSTKEYAFYTLANTTLAAMVLLADGGISTAVMALGGKVWNNEEKLSVVLTSGMRLRRKFALGSLSIAIPVLLILLIRNHASYITSLLIVITLVPAFIASLSDSLLEIVPKLHQNIPPIQKNQLHVSTLRLILTILLLFFFPFAFIVLLANGLPRIYGNIKLKEIVYKIIPQKSTSNKQVEKEILGIVKRVLPTSIYYCVSSQLTVWLISIFGKTVAIAQIGALSRISMILGILGIVINTLVIPRFSRLKGQRVLFVKYVIYILSSVFACCLILFMTVDYFSDWILILLGRNYTHLSKELDLSIIGSCIALLGGISYSLYCCRGWIIYPALIIGIDLSAVISGLFIFDISSVTGVLYYNIFTLSILFISNTFFLFYKITKAK